MNNKDLAAIRARCEAATLLYRERFEHDYGSYRTIADLIRTDIPALLDEIARVTAERDALQKRMQCPYGTGRKVDKQHFAVVEEGCTEIYSYEDYYATPHSRHEIKTEDAAMEKLTGDFEKDWPKIDAYKNKVHGMPDITNVVKALRVCQHTSNCVACPYIAVENCAQQMNATAADLLESLDAENKRLKSEVEAHVKSWHEKAARIAELEAALPVQCGDCVHCAWYADYCTDMRLPKNKRNRYICLKRSTLGENAVKAKLERDAIWVIDDENDFCSYGKRKDGE